MRRLLIASRSNDLVARGEADSAFLADFDATARVSVAAGLFRGFFLRAEDRLDEGIPGSAQHESAHGETIESAARQVRSAPSVFPAPRCIERSAVRDQHVRHAGPRLHAIDGGAPAVLAESRTDIQAHVSRRPCHVLNLAGDDGDGLLVGIGLALASGAVGAAYIEGITPRAPARRVRVAQFAAAALAREGHAVVAWGRLCFGSGAALAASTLMPSLVVSGPENCDREQYGAGLIVVGPSCDPGLVDLLRQTVVSDAPPLIVAVGNPRDDADLTVRLGLFESKAIARGVLPVGAARRALLGVTVALEAGRS